MNRRTITFFSQTAAFTAQKILQKNGIKTRLVRLSARETPRGCSWGLLMDSLSVNAAIYLLRQALVPFGDVLGG